MKKKIKFNQIIDILFWTIIIVMALIELYNAGINNTNILDFESINFQDVSVSECITYVLTVVFIILIGVILGMIRVYFLTSIYFGLKIANKKYNKNRLEKVDLKNDNYYRDILPKYSPAVLSYLDDFKINKKDVVATILMLELKGKIKIEQDAILLLDETTEGLEENEKYILNKVKEKTLKDINMLEYTRIVMNDALRAGLLQEKKVLNKVIKKKIIISVLIYSIVILCFLMIPLLTFLLIFMPFIITAYVFCYTILIILHPYVRSEEGKTMNIKLKGLRKYLINFSKIEDKTKEQLILWEDYLIYSVILGINTKVIDEVYDKIKNI